MRWWTSKKISVRMLFYNTRCLTLVGWRNLKMRINCWSRKLILFSNKLIKLISNLNQKLRDCSYQKDLLRVSTFLNLKLPLVGHLWPGPISTFPKVVFQETRCIRKVNLIFHQQREFRWVRVKIRDNLGK